MARNDIPNGWDKIRQNVQETERLMGQKQYNQSMIKAKQTVEYMVKLQCEQAGIMEGSMDSMIHELYNNGWISKSTAEHYLQIYDIGTKAAKNGDMAALQDILRGVLSTDEGKRLAESLRKAMQ